MAGNLSAFPLCLLHPHRIPCRWDKRTDGHRSGGPSAADLFVEKPLAVWLLYHFVARNGGFARVISNV
ncbi:MAG: hypothetical protein M3N23_07770, partial [Pseudomonadota bacterium]|nr:hypothetical protein [Pseudomonadota bacterium]